MCVYVCVYVCVSMCVSLCASLCVCIREREKKVSASIKMFERARLSEIGRDRLNAGGGGREKGNSQGILTQGDDSVQLTSTLSNLISLKWLKKF